MRTKGRMRRRFVGILHSRKHAFMRDAGDVHGVNQQQFPIVMGLDAFGRHNYAQIGQRAKNTFYRS